MKYDLTCLSFGAGIQSTALLGLCLTGEPGFPKPDLVIYADTQSELKATDEHVEWSKGFCQEHGVELRVVTAGSLERAQLGLEASRQSGFRVSIPAFTEKGGMLRRQCTRHHKVEVIERAVRAALGFAPGERIAGRKLARQFLGISTDEADRMKPARVRWIENHFPLVDNRMSRWDCAEVIQARGWPLPPKSSCVFCPYKSDRQWSSIKESYPDEFRRAVAVDAAIREGTRFGADDKAYLHRSLLPLAQVDFDALLAEDRAQMRFSFAERGGWGNECEGMCGL